MLLPFTSKARRLLRQQARRPVPTLRLPNHGWPQDTAVPEPQDMKEWASLGKRWLEYSNLPHDNPQYEALLAAYEGRWVHFVLISHLHARQLTDIRTYADQAARQGNREAFWYVRSLDPEACGLPESYLDQAEGALDQTLADELRAGKTLVRLLDAA